MGSSVPARHSDGMSTLFNTATNPLTTAVHAPPATDGPFPHVPIRYSPATQSQSDVAAVLATITAQPNRTANGGLHIATSNTACPTPDEAQQRYNLQVFQALLKQQLAASSMVASTPQPPQLSPEQLAYYTQAHQRALHAAASQREATLELDDVQRQILRGVTSGGTTAPPPPAAAEVAASASEESQWRGAARATTKVPQEAQPPLVHDHNESEAVNERLCGAAVECPPSSLPASFEAAASSSPPKQRCTDDTIGVQAHDTAEGPPEQATTHTSHQPESIGAVSLDNMADSSLRRYVSKYNLGPKIDSRPAMQCAANTHFQAWSVVNDLDTSTDEMSCEEASIIDRFLSKWRKGDRSAKRRRGPGRSGRVEVEASPGAAANVENWDSLADDGGYGKGCRKRKAKVVADM